jgi:tellurite resistance-related uncharacterized protein
MLMVVSFVAQCAILPFEYWRKVEFLTEDTQLRVDFYADKNSEIVQDNLSERNA